MEEAERWAATLGVAADYRDHLPIAELMTRALLDARDAGMVLPRKVVASRRAMERHLKGRPPEIALTVEKGAVYLNPHDRFFAAPGTGVAHEFAEDYWTTDLPHHPLMHEIAHVGHQRRLGANWDPMTNHPLYGNVLAEVTGKVPERALASIGKFVAEVKVGLVAGVQFDAVVVRWYAQLQGP